MVMKSGIKYYKTLFYAIISLMLPVLLQGQTTTNPYRIEGDEVVFTFDIRSYGKALTGKNAAKVDFADLKIYDVAISGGFNNWSRQGWKMVKKNDFVYELRKALEDFNESFPFEFKYIINGKFVADPIGKNSDSRQFTDDFLEEVYSLDLSAMKITNDGNVIFRLNSHQDAKQVILTGSFNGWDEDDIKMVKDADGWHLRAYLPPGRYEYKFIADGEWLHDPENKVVSHNEHGTLNSILDVTVPFTFTLKGFPDARKVILTGSFVEWHESKLRMTNINGVWTYTIPLVGGKHHYKFIVDGQWIT